MTPYVQIHQGLVTPLNISTTLYYISPSKGDFAGQLGLKELSH
jgi:hypothetical protein